MRSSERLSSRDVEGDDGEVRAAFDVARDERDGLGRLGVAGDARSWLDAWSVACQELNAADPLAANGGPGDGFGGGWIVAEDEIATFEDCAAVFADGQDDLLCPATGATPSMAQDACRARRTRAWTSQTRCRPRRGSCASKAGPAPGGGGRTRANETKPPGRSRSPRKVAAPKTFRGATALQAGNRAQRLIGHNGRLPDAVLR